MFHPPRNAQNEPKPSPPPAPTFQDVPQCSTDHKMRKTKPNPFASPQPNVPRCPQMSQFRTAFPPCTPTPVESDFFEVSDEFDVSPHIARQTTPKRPNPRARAKRTHRLVRNHRPPTPSSSSTALDNAQSSAPAPRAGSPPASTPGSPSPAKCPGSAPADRQAASAGERSCSSSPGSSR